MKLKILLILILLSILVGCSQPTKDDKYVTINPDVSVSEFIKYVSKVTNTKIVMKENIKEKTHFVAPNPILKTRLIPLVNAILNTHEMLLLKTGSHDYKVIKSSTDDLNVCRVNNLYNHENETMNTVVFQLEEINATLVQIKIKPLLSRNAKVIFTKKKKLLFVTAYSSSLRSIKVLIEKLKSISEEK